MTIIENEVTEDGNDTTIYRLPMGQKLLFVAAGAAMLASVTWDFAFLIRPENRGKTTFEISKTEFAGMTFTHLAALTLFGYGVTWRSRKERVAEANPGPGLGQ